MDTAHRAGTTRKSSVLSLAARKHPTTAEDLVSILDAVDSSVDAAVCFNPSCDNVCAWPQNGRPARFCSQTCKQDYIRTRERLLGEIELIGRFLEHRQRQSDKQRRLRREVAQREWVLDRFPPLA